MAYILPNNILQQGGSKYCSMIYSTKYTHKLSECLMSLTLHGEMHWRCIAPCLSFKRIMVTVVWHYVCLTPCGHSLPKGDTVHCIITIVNKRQWCLLSIRKVMENISHPRTRHQMC